MTPSHTPTTTLPHTAGSNPPLAAPGHQRLWMILLAIASLGTTVLIGLNIWVRQSPTAQVAVAGGAATSIATTPIHPPVLGTVPPFRLTDQTGHAFGSRQLRGKAWVAGFIFTRCAGPCPMITSQMARLHQELGDWPNSGRVQFVSVTVDPQHDTPQVLQRYARLAHADPDRWRFLTGDQQQVWRLIRSGFMLPVEDNPDQPDAPIIHSQKLVLVDQAGQIRGYYDGLDASGQAALRRDLRRLLGQQPPHAAGSRQPHQPVHGG